MYPFVPLPSLPPFFLARSLSFSPSTNLIQTTRVSEWRGLVRRRVPQSENAARIIRTSKPKLISACKTVAFNLRAMDRRLAFPRSLARSNRRCVLFPSIYECAYVLPRAGAAHNNIGLSPLRSRVPALPANNRFTSARMFRRFCNGLL